MPAIRFSGMASGLDTEKMVKELMNARKEPMNRLIREKQVTEWKRDAYREMNSLLMDLRTSVDSLRFSASFNKKKAVSENDAAVAANVVGNPTQASYAVKVVGLAEAEMPASMAIELDASIKDTTTAIGGGTLNLTINGKAVTVNGSETLDQVIANIKKETGMEATFSGGKLWIASTPGMALNSNGDKAFSFTASGDTSKLKAPASATSSDRTGKDAEVVINGVTYTSKTNKITVDGVEFTLKQPGAAISVNNQIDEDSLFNTIKGFVTKYNETIAKINEKVSEKKNKGYQPLLDEERESLPEKTAEKMEAMAKSGMLLRDSILQNGLDSMRRALSIPLGGTGVNTAFDTLSEIGIGGPPNGKYAYQENGKLYIDENKLRAAIRTNGEEVTKLFTSFSNDPADNEGTKYQKSGVAERLYKDLTRVIDRVTKEAGSSTSVTDDSFLGRKMKGEEDEIRQWKDRLTMIENRYYKQFTAMEKMMSKAQSQGSWFAQMLGKSQ
ncbi:flagellar filament capping protein FliD [Brevibacillus sp. Leaf182]|uniref:flagellar filament capping protein FliD n=1 Tax=Brevibacillus sp. Leaf182 TaxID=1736290 RepID=UPI0006FD7EAF|nr:flagellar filament capping protein FliD [Brevibacillus sp. Leaf182]RAT98707.1 flagellar hook protein [Brevibacillus sp. Leaf182]